MFIMWLVSTVVAMVIAVAVYGTVGGAGGGPVMPRRRTGWVAGGATLFAATLIVPHWSRHRTADGFDGYIQSGTCAAPTDDLRVKLDGDGDHDIEPYLARTGTGDETVVLGYYGSPGVPGFGVGAIYTRPAVLDGDHGRRDRRPGCMRRPPPTRCRPVPRSGRGSGATPARRAPAASTESPRSNGRTWSVRTT